MVGKKKCSTFKNNMKDLKREHHKFKLLVGSWAETTSSHGKNEKGILIKQAIRE